MLPCNPDILHWLRIWMLSSHSHDLFLFPLQSSDKSDNPNFFDPLLQDNALESHLRSACTFQIMCHKHHHHCDATQFCSWTWKDICFPISHFRLQQQRWFQQKALPAKSCIEPDCHSNPTLSEKIGCQWEAKSKAYPYFRLPCTLYRNLLRQFGTSDFF